jgi:hypothetical protein
MNRDAIKNALSRFGQGLSSGDAVVVAEAWAIPATIFMDAGAAVATTQSQLADVFKRSIQSYRKRELVATRPEIENVEDLGPKLAAVRVRWPAFDRAGVERASERSYYIVQEGEDGRVRIRVAAAIAEQ